MTVATDAAWNATAAAPALAVMYLIELAFTTGMLRVTNWPTNVTALGFQWLGLGVVSEVGELRESEDGQYQKLTVGLTQVQSSYLALALGSAETYQDKSAKIWVAIADANTLQIAGAPVLRFAGVMDMVRIERDAESNTGKVLLDLQAGAYNVRSNPAALRMNQAQHSARRPGETGFRYITDLIGRPQVWLSKESQQR